MANPKDDGGDDTGQNNVKSPAGRVEVDSRGNSVWRWARAALDSTSVLLKRLENRDLALEPTRKVPIQRGARPAPGAKRDARNEPSEKLELADTARNESPEKLGLADTGRRDKGGGFDPYNSR